MARPARQLRRRAAYINKPRLSVAESLLGVVVRRKKPLQVENVQVSSRYQSVDVARSEGLGFVAERAAGLSRPGDRHVERLYRPAPQLLERRDPHPLGPGRSVGHRHREGAALRTDRRTGRAVAAEREALRHGPAGGRGRPRNSQSADGHEDALPLAGPEVSRRRPARQGRANHRPENGSSEQDRGARARPARSNEPQLAPVRRSISCSTTLAC